MSKPNDDFEATKILVETLAPFESSDQQRIIRWACEKLGINAPNALVSAYAIPAVQQADQLLQAPVVSSSPSGQVDIKSFVNSKNPTSDMQFAAVIAYYFAFEAPDAQRKSHIGSADLQDSCRLLGRERLKDPGQTLRNTCFNGLLDKAEEKGTFKINTVGENLVAVTLPGDGEKTTPRKSTVRKKQASKKKAVKKKSTVKKKNVKR